MFVILRDNIKKKIVFNFELTFFKLKAVGKALVLSISISHAPLLPPFAHNFSTFPAWKNKKVGFPSSLLNSKEKQEKARKIKSYVYSVK